MIGKRIKEARNLRDFSQEALSKKLNLTSRSLINYEKGQNEPTVSMVIKIAKICDVSDLWLLTGKGEMFLGNENPTKNFVENKNISIEGSDNFVSGNYISNNKNAIFNNNEKKAIENIRREDITQDDLEVLKYFKKLSSKKQEYYFYLIKADVLKDEIDNNFK